MNRPEPRKSALSGSVVAPPEHIDGKAGNAGACEKVTVRIPSEVAQEARAAFWRTGPQTSTRSLSAWIAEAIQQRLERDRVEFNDGAHFEALPPGEIPTGRR